MDVCLHFHLLWLLLWVSPSLYATSFLWHHLCISLHNYLSLINICLFLQVAQHYRSTELHWMYSLEQLLTLNGGVSFSKHSFFLIHKNYNYAISRTEILLELKQQTKPKPNITLSNDLRNTERKKKKTFLKRRGFIFKDLKKSIFISLHI